LSDRLGQKNGERALQTIVLTMMLMTMNVDNYCDRWRSCREKS